MELAEITSLIGSLGFPIVAWFYMVKQFGKTLAESTSAITDACNLIRALHRRLDEVDFEERGN